MANLFRPRMEKPLQKTAGTPLHFLVISLAVSLGIFWYLLSRVSLAEVLHIISGLSFSWLGLFLLFSFSMSFFRTWRYQVLLAGFGYRTGSVALFLITLVRNFFSDLLPARLGTLMYVYLVRTRLGVPIGPVVSSFAYAFIFDILALALMIVPAIMAARMVILSPFVLLAAGLLLGLASIIVLALLPGICSLAGRVCMALSPLPERWRKWLNDGLAETEKYLLMARDQGIFWKILSLSFAVRCCKYFSLFVLLLGFVIPLGYSVAAFPFSRVFLGLVSAELAASLPISGIGGFGVYEGTWALVFQVLGYPERIAILTSISHHLFTQVYGYSLGGLAMMLLLLPIFIDKKDKSLAMAKDATKGFWLRYFGCVAGIALLTIVFFHGVGGEAMLKHASANPMTTQPQGEKTPLQVERPVGKVVYQRRDGIYLTDIQTAITYRLVADGRYPRWSPDGSKIVFVRGKRIMVMAASKGAKPRQVARAEQAKAVCFGADGTSVLFTDGKSLKEVDLRSLRIREIVSGGEFRELDVSEDGQRIAATSHTITGFRVKIFERSSGKEWTVARGCSASLSPDGRLVTVNGSSHTQLFIYKLDNLQLHATLSGPENGKFDNQFWSNHPDWLVSTSEGEKTDILLHHIPTGKIFKVTTFGDCDRGDAYIVR